MSLGGGLGSPIRVDLIRIILSSGSSEELVEGPRGLVCPFFWQLTLGEVLLRHLGALPCWRVSLVPRATHLLISCLLLDDLVFLRRVEHAGVFLPFGWCRLLVMDELALGLLRQASSVTQDALLMQVAADLLHLLQSLQGICLNLDLHLPVLLGLRHLVEESLELLVLLGESLLLRLREVGVAFLQVVDSGGFLTLGDSSGGFEDAQERWRNLNLVQGEPLLGGTFLLKRVDESLEGSGAEVVGKLKKERKVRIFHLERRPKEEGHLCQRGDPVMVVGTYLDDPSPVILWAVALVRKPSVFFVLPEQLLDAVHGEAFDDVQPEDLHALVVEAPMAKEKEDEGRSEGERKATSRWGSSKRFFPRKEIQS